MTKKSPSTADALRAVMAEHSLTYPDVADLFRVSPKTVESWLCSPDAGMHRVMPARHLELLPALLPSFLVEREAREADKAAAAAAEPKKKVKRAG